MKSLMFMISLMSGIENPDFADRTTHHMQSVGVSYHGATIVHNQFTLDGETMKETMIGYSSSSHFRFVGNSDTMMLNLNYPLLAPSLNVHVDVMKMDMFDTLSFGLGYVFNDNAELKFNIGGRNFKNLDFGRIDSEFANLQLILKF